MEKWERMAREIVEDWRADDGGLTAAALDVVNIGRSLDANPITSWEAYEWANREGI